MNETMRAAIKNLAEAAGKAKSCDESLKFSQSALNLAHAEGAMLHTDTQKSGTVK